MGYDVYWHNNRFQGYGVPAYCDYPNCKKVIDRGLGYAHIDNDSEPADVFCCDKHSHLDINKFTPEKTNEHPSWIKHILNDDSWSEWRKDNKKIVERLSSMYELGAADTAR